MAVLPLDGLELNSALFWDPFTLKIIITIDNINYRTARLVNGNYQM